MAVIAVVGVGGCSGGSGGSDESNPVDFAHSANSIVYTGFLSPAEIDKGNASKFLDALLGTTLDKFAARSIRPATEVDLDGLRNNISRLKGHLALLTTREPRSSARNNRLAQRETETENCDLSGTTVTETYSPTEFKLHFSECVDADGVKTNGTINISFTIISDENPVLETAIFSYSNYFIDTAVSKIELSGRVNAEFSPIGCNDKYRFELTSRDTLTLEQSWFSNFVYTEYCSANDENLFAFDGDIYLSDEGYLSVTTIVNLREQLTNSAPFPDLEGLFMLTGLSSRLAIEIYERFNAPENLDYDPLGGGASFSTVTLMSFKFDLNGDDIDEDVLTLPVRASEPLVSPGSFADTDGDLMIDIWENFYGLDSSDPNDAMSDLDGDGFTNLQESQGFSNPTVQLEVPLFNGTLSVGLQNSNQMDLRKGQEFVFTVALQTVAQNLPKRYGVDMYLSSNANLVSPSQGVCGPDPAGNGLRLCRIEYETWGSNEGTNDRNHTYTVESMDEGPITVDLKYRIEQFVDTDDTPNEIGFNVTFAERVSDLALESRGIFSLIFDNLEVGTVRTREITVSNSGPDLARNVVVEIDFPATVEIHLAHARLDSNGQIFPCISTAQNVTCNLGEIPDFGGSGYFDLVIEAEALAEGIMPVSASITSDSIDPDFGNNDFPHQIYAGIPSTSIQMLIDVANDGDTILVPDGYYIGGFNTDGKSLNFFPQSGKGSVHIWNYREFGGLNKIILGGLSQASIFRDFLIYGAGYAIFARDRVSIENNDFYSVRMYGFGNPENCIATGIELYQTIDSRVDRNYFECSKIDTQASVSQGHQNLEITNNVFVRNTTFGSGIIGVIFLDGISPGASFNGIYRVKNNTLVGPAESGIYLSSNDHQVEVSEIYNNILLNIDEPIDFSNSQFFSLSKYDIQNNIVYGYTDLDSSLLSSNLLANPTLDPLNLIPEAGSIAIDAGLPEASITMDFYSNPRPVDGDGDTNALIDIGAVEVQ